LPQVLLMVAPSLVNQFTVIVKSSTLVSVITVQDLMFQSQKIVHAWLDPIEILTATAAIYIVVIFAVSALGKMVADVLRRRYGLDTLRLDGVVLLANYAGKFLGDPAFEPLMQELDRRKAALFVHPGMHPSSRTLGTPWPGFMLEFVIDTSRAAVNLLFSGALE